PIKEYIMKLIHNILINICRIIFDMYGNDINIIPSNIKNNISENLECIKLLENELNTLYKIEEETNITTYFQLLLDIFYIHDNLMFNNNERKLINKFTYILPNDTSN